MTLVMRRPVIISYIDRAGREQRGTVEEVEIEGLPGFLDAAPMTLPRISRIIVFGRTGDWVLDWGRAVPEEGRHAVWPSNDADMLEVRRLVGL